MSDSGTRNYAAWLAPLVALFGFLSYYTIFNMYPVLRDVPWLNLLILTAAIALGALAFQRAGSTAGKVGAGAGLALSVALTGLLSLYAFYLSYQLPDAGRVKGEGTPVPTMKLASWDGQPIDLGAASRDKLVLVFYRGHW